MLYQTIYSSQATQPMSEQDLESILNDARTGNESRDVTGVLVFRDGVFLQVLEGERQTVEDLLKSIESDSRHRDVTIFHQMEVSGRTFGSWQMAYVCPDPEELSKWVSHAGTATIESVADHMRNNKSHLPKILLSIVEALTTD